MPWYSPIMTADRILYRDYLIELEHDAQGWRAMAITHGVRGATILPPGLYHPDRASAERYAKTTVDAHSNADRRWRGIDK